MAGREDDEPIRSTASQKVAYHNHPDEQKVFNTAESVGLVRGDNVNDDLTILETDVDKEDQAGSRVVRTQPRNSWIEGVGNASIQMRRYIDSHIQSFRAMTYLSIPRECTMFEDIRILRIDQPCVELRK